jgi:hypothetical protein
MVSVVLVPCSSYSESISPYYGYTGNAASNGLGWSMDSVFPDPPGLEVNAVLYNYTIQKAVEDSVTVNVQNENALGTGYIFRETDEWRPGSLGGTQINKVIGLPNIHRSYWGDGSIEVEGNGSVTDPSVIYSYRVDPCYDPQYDPNCPGYEPYIPDIPVVDVDSLYDATDSDAYIAEACKEGSTDVKCDSVTYENKEEKEIDETEEEKDSKERLEKALAAVDNTALFAQSFAQASMLQSMNAAVNMESYTAATIDGGQYKETIVLDGGQLQDNKQGRRMNMSSQILHDKMVDLQYNR